ncbi:MAG: transcription antitermination factor NusB [Eubacterium sp.]|nr:transcription antitermination factor NusB [Eubacterium sp.]MDD5994752.1 transcription antitermination factor NusB [Clostridiales bacterium]MDY3774135.1 transcription antitermination factor NusB [Eubacterium sp.]
MTRKEIREQVFILLFQREFYGEEPFEEQKETYMSTKEISEKDLQYIEKHTTDIMDKLPEIDSLISEYSKGWKIDRIGKEELAILRLAIYEAKYDEEIPVGVAVNEAVELAKTYGADGGAAFVNGILGKIVNE